MSTQLDILALEPFYGGARRLMLESVTHCSRHRWTLLKLPPRRIERRLTAAAHWFGEQLSRHWAGRCDLLFTSEALNLSDLYRAMPALLKKPSVVYFHSNQLPEAESTEESPLDLINLNTAAAAHEIWFNSLFHLRSFLAKASALVRRHPELATHSPMPQLTAKAQLMYPPIDCSRVIEIAKQPHEPRQLRTIFVETRDADTALLNRTLSTLQRRGEKFHLITIGNLDGVSDAFPRETLSENDDEGQIRAMMRAGIYLSVRRGATCDHHAMRALLAGCLPVVPDVGVYRELLPPALHSMGLYHGDADRVAGRLQDLWHVERPSGYMEQVKAILHQYDPMIACPAIDDRLSAMVNERAKHD